MGLFGLGKPDPSRFPYTGRPQPSPGIGPSQGQVVRARIIIVSGPGGGVYAYSPTPGAGNLVATAGLAANGTDLYGNPTLAGNVTYNFGLLIAQQEFAGGIKWYVLSGGTWLASGPSVQWTSSGLAVSGASGGTSAAQSVGLSAGPSGHVSIGGASSPASVFWLPPSGDTTGVTDAANLALLLPGGNAVYLLPGTYYVNGPVTVPSGAMLACPAAAGGNPSANFGAGGLPLTAAVIKAVAGFAGAAVIDVHSSGSQAGGQSVLGIAVDGSALTGANTVHGIQLVGAVANAKVRDCVVYGGGTHQLGGSGIYLAANADGQPDALTVEDSLFCFSTGPCVNITVGVSDSLWSGVSATASLSDAWSIVNSGSSYFRNCKGQTSAGFGFNLNGVGGFGGHVHLTDCESELNTTGGFGVRGGGGGTYWLTSCYAADTTPWTYAGSNIVNTTGGNFEQWYRVAPQNGWANSGLGPTAGYRYEGKKIEVIADMTAGTLVAGTQVLTLPAIAHDQQMVLTDLTVRTAQATLAAGAAGGVTFFQSIGAVAAADRCFVHGWLSTDA